MPNTGLRAQCWDYPGCLSPLNDEQANKFTLFRGHLGDSVLGRNRVSPTTLQMFCMPGSAPPLVSVTPSNPHTSCEVSSLSTLPVQELSPLATGTNLMSSWTYDSNLRLSDSRAQGWLVARLLNSMRHQNNLSENRRQPFNSPPQNPLSMDGLNRSLIRSIVIY